MRRDQYRTPPKPKIAIIVKATKSWGSVGGGRAGASSGMARSGMARDLTAVLLADQMNYRNAARYPRRAVAWSFFVNLAALYSRGRRKPAMAINGRRNKPIGPGGSTRRLHRCSGPRAYLQAAASAGAK